jgi:hypothetical protein
MSKVYKETIENFKPEKTLTIIDCWRQVDVEKAHENIKIKAIGREETSQKKVSEAKAFGTETI